MNLSSFETITIHPQDAAASFFSRDRLLDIPDDPQPLVDLATALLGTEPVRVRLHVLGQWAVTWEPDGDGGWTRTGRCRVPLANGSRLMG